jgi:hypothetical protein
MPVNESIDLKKPGQDKTGKASSAITGKRFVRYSGNRTGGGHAGLSTDLANVYQIAPCNGTTQVPCGVANFDIANGALGSFKSGAGRHVTVTSGAAITAGVLVMADATGRAITFVGPVATNAAALPSVPIAAGIAATGASGADVDVEVQLLY